MKVPFSPPDFGDDEINEVVDTLRSGWITTGPKTKKFEELIARYCGTNRAVCLNSATIAMELVLRYFGIGQGDEVITSAYTFTASASVICHVGAKPVLVDTAPGSYFMDIDAISKAITPKTKAIIPVDLAGIPCDYNALYSVVENYRDIFKPSNNRQAALGRILLLADAAHSIGASRDDIMTGGLADFTCFSFHAVKNITTAEGGALTWKPLEGSTADEIYKQFMLYSLHGQSKDALAKTQLGGWEYDIIAPHYKCNMTDIMAALGLAQLKRYGDLIAARKKIVERYLNILSQSDKISILDHMNSDYISCYHLFMLRILPLNEAQRNMVIAKLAEKEIATNVHYKPLPLLSAYKNMGFEINDFPNAYNQYCNEITLPLHTLLTNEMIDYTAESLMHIVQKIS
ncbi:MAG: DegT/DnrJ/EryC1/StrS family aminotransferase [Oscillospiraceae bacterium]|nr:DegT/DnrJ/EryC1/StrS family aminotransferase [Oscillospiraceae bacterium]